MEFDIFVPSKGRPDGTTFSLLKKSRMVFTIVLEPQDVATYKEVFKHCRFANFLVLPRNNMGIGYSRAHILRNAQRPFVLIDDDIHTIYKNGKHVGIGSMLNYGWKKFIASGKRGILGFKNSTFAIPENDVTINTIVAHIVFMNPYDGLKYDKNLRAFEDIDIVFQCIHRDLPVQRLNTYIYYTTPSGKGTHGGIDYGHNARVKRDALSIMVKRWPRMISYDRGDITANGQPRYVVHIRKITYTVI